MNHVITSDTTDLASDALYYSCQDQL